MSGKFRKIFDGKHFVKLDRPFDKKGKIYFFELQDVDALQREYDELTIEQIVYPTTMWKLEDRRWFLLSKIIFKKFKLLKPKLADERLEFDYESEESHEEYLDPWPDYNFGAK